MSKLKHSNLLDPDLNGFSISPRKFSFAWFSFVVHIAYCLAPSDVILTFMLMLDALSLSLCFRQSFTTLHVYSLFSVRCWCDGTGHSNFVEQQTNFFLDKINVYRLGRSTPKKKIAAQVVGAEKLDQRYLNVQRCKLLPKSWYEYLPNI